MATEKIANIMEEIKTLTILELKDLVKALEEEFGVSAAPVAVAAAPGAAVAEVEEKTEFDVELTSYDEAAKLKVIKAVKELADTPSKEVLVGKVLGSLQSPLYGLCFGLQAIIDKAGEGSDDVVASTLVAAAPAAEAPAEA